MSEQKKYRSYLIRMWQVTAEGERTWRACLEDPHTGERKGFGDLERLFAFLREQAHLKEMPAEEEEG